MNTYTVTVKHEDDLWVAYATDRTGDTVTVLDFDDFADLRATMPYAIADMLDLDPLDIHVDWRYEIDGHDVTAQVEAARAATVGFEDAQRQRDTAVRAAITALRSAGLSQAAIGDAVGLSKQRVSQILANRSLARSA